MKIQKQLSDNLTLYFTNNFPYLSKNKSYKKYDVFLGIGGNIGDMFKRYDSLLKRFQYDKRIIIKETSPLLKNPPFGYLEQNYFLNGIIKIETNLHPIYLLKIMQKYENKFGRKRSFKDAPRTLDIDIIFIQRNNREMKINTKVLVVPHIGWMERDSVQIPLHYMKTKTITKYKVKEC